MKITNKSVLDDKTLYFYVVICICIIYAFSTINITLNIVFGTIIAFYIINFLYVDYKDKQDDENNIKKYEHELILPKPKKLHKYENIIKFLFSIQDFYIYNPQAYEELVQSLHNFFTAYEENYNNKKISGINHELMESYKRNAINSLHSIIHNLPNDIDYTKKLDKAIIVLQNILDNYIEKINKMNKEYIYENGYNIDVRHVNKGEVAYNALDYDVHNYSFDIFS